MSDSYVTIVYKLPQGVEVAPLLTHPYLHSMVSRNALQGPSATSSVPAQPELAKVTRERDHLQEIVNAQQAAIKALTFGCEKYGLTETTPVVRHMDAMAEELRLMQIKLDSRLRDARLGDVALKFVDRAGDPCPNVDPAEKICAEFASAMVRAFDAPLPAANSMVRASLYDFVNRASFPTAEDASLTVADYRRMAYEALTGVSPLEPIAPRAPRIEAPVTPRPRKLREPLRGVATQGGICPV